MVMDPYLAVESRRQPDLVFAYLACYLVKSQTLPGLGFEQGDIDW